MRDMTRMALMSALVEYLRSHATQRYQVLEMFARAEVEIGLALRPAFMQDLLGLVRCASRAQPRRGNAAAHAARPAASACTRPRWSR